MCVSGGFWQIQSHIFMLVFVNMSNNFYSQKIKAYCLMADMPVDESSSSEEEEEEVIVRAHAEIMCRGGNHSWSRGECRVCSVCGYCTGYGPNCVNTDRYLDPGM